MRFANARRSKGGLLTPAQVDTVQRTWRAVLPVGDTFAELFYGRLFALDARLPQLFHGDMVEQGRSLTAMLSVVAGSLERPERIVRALRQLGERHAAYGVTTADFATVEDALLFALEHALIDVFSEDVKAAWRAAYAFLAGTMIESITAGRSPATARGCGPRGR